MSEFGALKGFDYMCELCLAECIAWVFLPGIYLEQATKDGDIMKAGDFGLTFSNDPFVIFSTVPVKDPGWEMTDAEIYEAAKDPKFDKEEDDFYLKCNSFRKEFVMEPEIGWKLVKVAIQAGYDPEGNIPFHAWIFQRMAVILETPGKK